MIVIVDSNEQATNPRIVERLRKHFPELSVSKLASGDVNVITPEGKVVAIERKDAGDLLGSIADGRVFSQVENMAEHANYSAIIVTGTIDYDKNDMVTIDGALTNWRGKSVRAAIAAIMWSACPVLKANEEDYALTIMEVVEFCRKPEKRLRGHQRIVTFPPLDARVDILAALPGVGVKRAEALLRFVGHDGDYGSLGDALCWASSMGSVREDVRPEGWGKVTVENIHAIMGFHDGERFVIQGDNHATEE